MEEKVWGITKRHLRYFEIRVRHWQARFGLYDWRIVVEKDDLGKDSGTGGAAFADVEARLAQIYLNIYQSLPPTKEHLDLVAFHEICEILVEPLRNMVRKLIPESQKRIANERIADVVHVVIRRLEHVILGVN